MSLKRDGQLDEETRAALDAHLAHCIQCQRWSQTMTAILDRAALPRLRASAGFEAGVVARASAPPTSNQSLRLQRPWLYALAGAAATLLATIAFGWLAGLTPTVQAGAVLDDALRSHQEAVMDFARSVTLLPGAKPEMEVDLVRRDLADSHLLPRTKELRALVRVAKYPERKPALEFLTLSENFLGEVEHVVQAERPKEAMVRIRRAAADVRPVTFAWHVAVRVDDHDGEIGPGKGAFVEAVPGEPIELQVVSAARRAYIRGNLPEAMNGFQTFVLSSEGNASLLPFLPFAQFSLERCEERLGLGDRGAEQQDVVTDAHGEKSVVVKLNTGKLSNVLVTGPQVERFFILLDKGGVKLDAHTKQIVEGALLEVTSPKR
jgi:hypothetical protein